MQPHTIRSFFTLKRSRWLVSALTIVALLALAVGAATPARAADPSFLPGSTFESGDGNLLVDTTGDTDWCNQPLSFTGTCPTASLAPNFVRKDDKPSGKTDDAFGQGTKEDTPVPTIVTGSIPPNKNDLTLFYVSNEFVGGKNFLYLAWERAVNNGSADIDFEFNQSSTLTSNGVTPVRTAGDLLVTYDFSGSGTPTLGLLRWVTSGSCFVSSDSPPCWGNQQTLGSAVANGAVNTAPVFDPILNTTLGVGLFGAAGFNLTDAGVFPANQCLHFGHAYSKARSSTSFNAEMKDFIAPATININNCGGAGVIKQDDFGNAQSGVQFQLFAGSTATGTPLFTCVTDSTGGCSFNDLLILPGTYTIHEVAPPAGFQAAPDQTVTLTLDESPVTLTFKDPKLPILNVHKQDDSGAAVAIQGAVFQLFAGSTATGTPIASCTTDASGNCSFGPQALGTYTVHESSVPAGFQAAPDQTTTLTSANLDQTVTLTFTDLRLFQVIVIVCQQSNNSLYPSTVTVNGVTQTSVGSGSAFQALCGTTAGAQFPNLPANDTGVSYPGSVHIPR